ncbi:MAG: hypothetical protein O7F12_12280 [Nitrospirae bacterium]|nr:hypothetical protein [Nitrospirota bacterium]
MKPNNPHIQLEIFRHIGQAVWAIQECEVTLTQYLRKHQAIPRNSNRRNMKKYLKKIQELGIFSTQLHKRIEQMLEDQQWLIHGVAGEVSKDFNGGSRVPHLLQRISALTKEAQNLTKDITEKLAKHT